MNIPADYSHIKSLSEDFSNLLNSEKFVDFTLVVKGKVFKIHRVVLAARSDFFAKMFSANMQEAADANAELKGIEIITFEEVLHYIYTGSVTATACRISIDLYAAADFYQIDGLKSICISDIRKNLSESNALNAYKLADLYKIEGDLKQEAFHIIKRKILNTQKDPIDDLSLQTVCDLCEAKKNLDEAKKHFDDLLESCHFMYQIDSEDEDFVINMFENIEYE